MGRGKIEIKRIENTTSRQVTFSKRRGGLLKKAYELSVLCDAQVAIIIFSNTGKLFEYANPSMKEVLDRYGKYSEVVQSGSASEHDNDAVLQYLNHEVLRLKEQIRRTHQTQRHMMGEDLAILSLKDLQQIEEKLDNGLRHVRARKDQLMLEQLEDLRRKEQYWTEENEALKRKLAGGQMLAGLAAPSLTIVNPLDTREPPTLATVSLPLSMQLNQQNIKETPNLQTSLRLG